MVKQRSLLGLVFLSLITFGIYGVAWYYVMTEDVNTVVGEDGKSINPGITILLCLFTFGIYPIIWLYSQGERMKAAGDLKGANIKETGSSYLLWYFVGSLIIIGPLVALAKFIKNYNILAAIYNANMVKN